MFSEQFRTYLREALFVKDRSDIPEGVQVQSVTICSIGHPGLCRDKDKEAGIYGAGGKLLWGIRNFVFQAPG